MATPQENIARFQEIASRGLQDRLDPDKRARFDEAARRGIIKIPAQQAGPSQAEIQAAHESGVPILDAAGNVIDPPDPAQQVKERSFGEQAVGVAEGLASTALTAPAALAGTVVGSFEGAARELITGESGQDIAERRIQQFTAPFAPVTEVGQETVGAIGEALEPLSSLPPVLPTTSQLQALSQPSRASTRVLVKQLQESSLPSITKSDLGFRKSDLSVGAAETPRQLERVTTAEGLPIPLTGESALTKGQATRNFEQLQFEKEAAKLGDLGEPLRDRVSKQAAVLTQNLDALAEQPGALRTEFRDIGQAVDSALVTRANRLKRREEALYKKADEAGEMREEISVESFPDVMEFLSEMDDVANNAGAIQKNAIKRGIIDAEGAPQKISLRDLESFRQRVNAFTDISDPREARVRRIVLNSIDEATESAGGDAYQQARRFAAKTRQEFENVGITKRLMASKRGTSERQIAYEDVFKKVFLDSPIEELNKVRGTLLKSGDDGKQAWADLKGKGIDYIKENAQNFNQLDEAGRPTLSPAKLNKVINSLDSQGKLDAIYGKRNAQVIRDLGELSTDVFTAPPGAVNFSNTASAMQVAMDQLGTFAVTGIPAPVANILRESTKFVKNAKKRKQVQESINFLSKQKTSN
jgi:hypothetical protein